MIIPTTKTMISSMRLISSKINVGILSEPVYIFFSCHLIKDQRKDYEPTVNRGKHRFVAKQIELNIDWNGNEIQQWRADIERLTRSHDNLEDWLKNGSEMLVCCASGFFCRLPTILTLNDLKQYVAMGVTLEDLKTRLKCSKCGKRGSKVTVF